MSRYALAPGHAREYETIYIMRPTVNKETAEQINTRITTAISENDGQLTSIELWGRRKMAYQVAKHHQGIYVYLKYVGKGSTVNELERQMRLLQEVIRYQTVQLQDNVVVGEVEVDKEALAFDYDLPEAVDEPEMTLERELGLDQAMDRLNRRDRDRDRDRPPPAAAEAPAAEAPAADAPAAAEAPAAEAPAAEAPAADAPAAEAPAAEAPAADTDDNKAD